MRTFTKTLTRSVPGLLTGLVFALGVAHAAPGGTVAGEKIVIARNTARDITTIPGTSASAKFLGFGGGGGRGNVKNTETTVQGVSVAAGAHVSADVTISGNKAEKIKNTGAKVTVQGLTQH